jgi:hypothetical protein
VCPKQLVNCSVTDDACEVELTTESSEFFDMPELTNRQRLESLETRMGTVETNLGIPSSIVPQKRDTVWRILGPTLTIMLTIVLSAIGATHFIDQQTAALSVRITKNESAIRVLGNQQSDQTQQLIHDLLSMAKTSANPEIAAKAAQAAASLTATLRQQKRSAVPEFFAETNQDLNFLRSKNEPNLKAVAFTTQQQLAEYRSALQPQKQIGTSFTCGPNFGRKDAFVAMGNSANPSHFVGNVTIVDCPQSLDGFAWKNVVFVNSRISYSGGPVVLDNVTFVNCSFKIEQNEEGTRLLQYAALDQNNLKVKSESLNPG